MPINPNIAMAYKAPEFDSPMNQLAQFMQMKQMQQSDQLNQMKMDEYGRGIESNNRLQSILRGEYQTPEARQDAILKGGFLKEAQDYGKGNADVLKTQSEAKYKEIETANKRADLAGSVFGYVRQNPTLDNALAAIDHLAANSIYSPDQAAEYKAKVQANPQAIAQMADLAFRGALDAKDQLAKLGDFNAGGSHQFTSTDPVSGKVTMTGAVPITESANNVANNKRIAQEGALNRNVQVRGQNLTDARAKEANRIAGEWQQSSSAPVLGAPVPAVLPWANQSNPKDANKVKANEQTRGAREIEKDLDAARKERDAAAAAKRFLELNKGTNTGGLLDRIGVTRSLQSLGSDYSEMESITAKLAPSMRVEGSGSTSDFDGKQFERATVGVDKPGATNQNIAKGVIARAQQSEEYADFRQTYLEQNGTLQGADRFWKDYANKNPIFDPAKEGTFELNNKRKTWKEHFKSGKPASPPAGGGLSPAEAAELADLRKRLGK